MSTQPATRSRWMDWKPKVRILAEPVESELTKQSKPGFVSFECATSAESPEIEVGPDPAELARASAILNRAGVRLTALEGGATIGVWSDLDGPEVRAALRTFGSDRLPLRYLDGAGIPMRYKVRRVDGEPVSTNVLAKMEQWEGNLMETPDPMEPPEISRGRPIEDKSRWTVRDRMLKEMSWCSKGIPWAEWKAAALNRLFQEQCFTGKPGRITAATVRHGERKAGGDD
ncbi:MAG: hypothetical protein LLG20_12910 [Acidobacteriales bacterium]|nr:hypothetical protein [Terriglobales bacterium]